MTEKEEKWPGGEQSLLKTAVTAIARGKSICSFLSPVKLMCSFLIIPSLVGLGGIQVGEKKYWGRGWGDGRGTVILTCVLKGPDLHSCSQQGNRGTAVGGISKFFRELSYELRGLGKGGHWGLSRSLRPSYLSHPRRPHPLAVLPWEIQQVPWVSQPPGRGGNWFPVR